jgi:hypothetical protein
MTGTNLITGSNNTVTPFKLNWTNGSPANSFGLFNSFLLMNSNDVSAVESIGPAGTLGHLALDGDTIYYTPNLTWTNPVINLSGASTIATIDRTYINDKGTGTGTFISIANDASHRVSDDIVYNGWTNSFPTGSAGIYASAGPLSLAAALVTAGTGWVEDDAVNYPAEYLKVGRAVIVRGAVKSGTFADATVVVNLPIGYRPNKIHRFVISYTDGVTHKAGHAIVAPSGNIALYGLTGNTQVWLDGINYTTT